MKQWMVLIVLCCGAIACTAANENPLQPFTVGKATFTVHGDSITVKTDRYTATFAGMHLRQLISNTAKQTFFRDQRATQAYSGGSLRLQSYMPGDVNRMLVPAYLQPSADAAENPATPPYAVSRLERGVEYRALGLRYAGKGEESPAKEYPEACLGMRLEYDEASGDLLISPFADTKIPAHNGVVSEGIDTLSFTMGEWTEDIRYLDPGGTTMKPIGQRNCVWPQGWVAALGVFEAPRGECAAIWADDPALEFGKRMEVAPITTVTSINANAPWQNGAIEGITWHVNVFPNWMKAALPYRAQMAKVHDLKPIEQRPPGHQQYIRIVTWDHYGDARKKFAYLTDRGVEPRAIMDWMTMGWLLGYPFKEHHAVIPNVPIENPQRVVARVPKDIASSNEAGFPVYPYLYMFGGMPETWKKRLTAIQAPGVQYYGAGKLYFRLYGDLVEQVVETYKVPGIYNDCSWVFHGVRDPRGKVDGLNLYQSHAHGRRHLVERFPNTAFMGERQHEFTVISDSIALMWYAGELHPINSFIFSPFSIRWNQMEYRSSGNAYHRILDACESGGFVPMKGNSGAGTKHEGKLTMLRSVLYATQQLSPYFPEKYEADVRGYLKGKDGTIYKYIRDRGSRFVRVEGKDEEMLCWRVVGISELATTGTIDDWVAYSDDGKIIGLNPQRYYTVFGTEYQSPKPPIVVSAMPEGLTLREPLILGGKWEAHIEGIEDKVSADQQYILPLTVAPEYSFTVNIDRITPDNPGNEIGLDGYEQDDKGHILLKLSGAELPAKVTVTWQKKKKAE